MKENISDKEILDMFRLDSSKNRAFELLVRKYQQKLYWQIRRTITDHNNADDVLQETFLKIWKGLDSFREDAQLYSWMFRIAHNECITWFRKNKNSSKNEDILNVNETEFINQENSENAYSSNHIEKKLREAIDLLPEKQKMIFHLKYYQELKYEEISELLGTSTGALKASYHIAVKKIENYLMNH